MDGDKRQLDGWTWPLASADLASADNLGSLRKDNRVNPPLSCTTKTDVMGMNNLKSIYHDLQQISVFLVKEAHQTTDKKKSRKSECDNLNDIET